MAIREVHASGLDNLALGTALLQRARTADPLAGLWEAADLQWWWRTPRRSDELDQLFWVDDEGPVAGVLLTDWDGALQCDPVAVPGVSHPPLSVVWAAAVSAVGDLGVGRVEVPVREDDTELLGLVTGMGFAATDERSGTTWMRAQDRPEVVGLPYGFMIQDRAQPTGRSHPMRQRNGNAVEERLRQCSLYDPGLDLEIVSADGDAAGYALFWVDPVTGVGLVEPMRVEEAFQRRGIARALLSAGLDRMAQRGASRFKVGFITDAARSLYVGAGFRVTEMVRSYVRDFRAPSGRPGAQRRSVRQ